MKIKEIQAKAGPIADYLWYIVLVFGWYFADNLYASQRPLFPESWLEPWVEWLVRLVLVPVVLAAVYGGIHDQQQSGENWDASSLGIGIKKHYWRVLLVNLLSLVFYLLMGLVIVIIDSAQGTNLVPNQTVLGLIVIPYSAVNLFWFSSLVLERKVFASLLRAIKTLLFNPYALVLGLAWGGLAFADATWFESSSGIEPSLTLSALRAAVLAVVRIMAVSYALAIGKLAQGDSPIEAETETSALAETASEGNGLVNASFGFALFSFVPLLHLVALTLGLVATLRKRRFGIRLALAWGLGGFFTLFYIMILTGWLVSSLAPATKTDYAFLTEVEPGLQPQVQLFEQDSFAESVKQLEPQMSASSEQAWAYDCALAIAKAGTSDPAGALQSYWKAAEKQPTRGEFYYLYGVALLKDGQTEKAAEQFQTALKYAPELTEAQRYLELVNSAYSTPELISSLLFIFILLILFSLHEYGHAWVAWKLGDDTAERQGRLTLNPIQHLDLFGSIILPGILLLQQSGMVFGWARPVPVDERNFKNPKKDQMRVAFAGPAVNLLVSMACCLILAALLIIIRLLWPETLALNLAAPFTSVSLVGPANARLFVVIILFIKQLFYTSLLLGFLNLIPIPPLDGSWILSGLLPQRLNNIFEQTRRFGFLLFLLLVLTPALDFFLGWPTGLVWGGLELLISALRFG